MACSSNSMLKKNMDTETGSRRAYIIIKSLFFQIVKVKLDVICRQNNLILSSSLCKEIVSKIRASKPVWYDCLNKEVKLQLHMKNDTALSLQLSGQLIQNLGCNMVNVYLTSSFEQKKLASCEVVKKHLGKNAISSAFEYRYYI